MTIISNNPIRLNLGAGAWRPAGYVTVDCEDADIRHDLTMLPWPFADASVDAILASHILEHMPKAQGRAFLAECARILVPGGVLHLAVPDMDMFIAARLTDDDSALGGYLWTNLNWLLGAPATVEDRPHWRHQTMYCWESLAWMCQAAGLTPQRATFGPPHTPEYRAISLYVDAVRAA